jgi:hypothetical protein
MKNIHLLPTGKPSRIHKIFDNSFVYSLNPVSETSMFNTRPQNIYITNDEKPTIDNWCYGMDGIFQYKGKINLPDIELPKKIILTTDQDLIKDGVQTIDDEFLNWFVKNPNCQEVEIKRNYLGSKCLKCGFIENHDEIGTEDCPKCHNITYEHLYKNKIIIPQEEPKLIKCYCGHTTYCDCGPIEEKQETLEEAAKDFIENTMKYSFNSLETKTFSNKLLKCVDFGAMWQAERMYSKEDVIQKILDFRFQCNSDSTRKEVEEWFKQFKKKK